MDTKKRWIEPLLADSSVTAMHFDNDLFDVSKCSFGIFSYLYEYRNTTTLSWGQYTGGRDTDKIDSKYKSSKAKSSAILQKHNCESYRGIVRGIARTQSPANKNCTPELTTFGLIAGVSQPECNGKPHPGRTTFVIMVSPVPGKYAGSSDSHEFTGLDWGFDGTSGIFGWEE